MKQLLISLHWKTLLIYLEGVIVIPPDFATHVSHLRDGFNSFRGAGLKLKPSKSALLQREVNYLGHVVGHNGVATDPDKMRTVEDWVTPQDLTGRAFLGLVGYYQQYIPDVVEMAQPLNWLTAKEIQWQ